MNKTELMNKLACAAADPHFEEALMAADSKESILALLNENGISVTADEMDAIMTVSDAPELFEDDLDAVAGGGWLWNHVTKYWNPGYWIGRLITKDVDMCD